MRDELLQFYERELTYLRKTGAEFAEKYSGVASRLSLEANKSNDPHVERLLEGFAFLAARIHLKLQDDLPEISEALLSVAYPHYVRPVPSMAVVEMEVDPEKGKLTSGFTVPRGSGLRTRPLDGFRCEFRTCYDVQLWPIRVGDASWSPVHAVRPALRVRDAVDALRLELVSAPDVSFSTLEIDTLRLHISADSAVAHALYELLLNNCVRVILRDPAEPGRIVELPGSALQPVGFADEEAVLPAGTRELHASRLLQEYFAFPAKFLFIDLNGLDRIRAAGFQERVQILFLISDFDRAERRQALEIGVSARTLRLGAAPVVNLFERKSEPIRLTQRRYEHLVVPDARRREEIQVFAVEEVAGVGGQNDVLRFEPFYAFRHGRGAAMSNTFWYAHRKGSGWRANEGTDTYLSFVDLSGRPVYPDRDLVTATVTCHNGDLPSRIPFGSERGDFEMPGGGPIARIMTLHKPTATVVPPFGQPQVWRMISHLSLNFTSLIDGGPEALQELLRLHNLGNDAVGDRQIAGLVGVQSTPGYARLVAEQGLTFARGHDINLELDESEFVGGGAYLFSAVLERFLAMSVALNTFARVTVRSRERKGDLAAWPARAGRRSLL